MTKQVVTNFLGGKVSERIRGRIETRVYPVAAPVMTNVMLAITGGFETRPGTIDKVRADNTQNADVRLEPLILTRTLAYILCMVPGQLKVYSVVGSVVTLVDTFNAPWDTNSMWRTTYERIGRIIVFCDSDFFPRTLTANAAGTTFTFDTFDFETRLDGTLAEPMFKIAPAEMTITASATTGSGITVTTSAAYWDNSYIGRQLQIHDGRLTVTGYSSPTVLTCDVNTEIARTLDLDPFMKKEGDSPTIVVQMIGHGFTGGESITISGAGVTTGVSYAALNTTHTVGTVIDEDHFEISVTHSGITEDFGGGSVKVSTASPTRNWKESVFGTPSGGNYPQAVARHQGRLWFMGTPALGDDRWGSRSGNPFNFDTGTGQDSHAVVAIGDVTTFSIRSAVSANDALQVFGDTKIVVMQPDGPITPRNNSAKIIPGNIGASYLRPIPHDGSVLYVDAIGLHVREMAPEVQDATQHTINPTTTAIPEIINGPIQSMGFEGSSLNSTPYSIWTNVDGSLAMFMSSRQEQAAAWMTWDTDGRIWSTCGVGSRLFLAVERDGETHIEEVDFDLVARADRSELLASGGAATDAWTAPAFFWGKAIDVFRTDGTFMVQATADALDGSFTTPTEETSVWIGLPATWEVELLPVVGTYRDGPRVGRRERIKRVVAQLYETTALRLMGVRLDKPAAAIVDDPPQIINGAREVRVLGWERNPRVRFSGSIAEKAHVLSALVEID